MKITFIKEHKPKQGDGKGPHYKTGETYDLETSYAEKYKRLGLAVDHVVPKPAPVPVPEPELPASTAEIQHADAAAPSGEDAGLDLAPESGDEQKSNFGGRGKRR